jgi:para-nitrobenzyl esterase
VRDNIAAFGGDPSRVMVHGESGGGGKIGLLLAMPPAAGLFNRAALQSGTANVVPTAEQATEQAEALLTELGIARADWRQLLTAPMDKILAAQAKLEIQAMTAPPGPGRPRRGFVPTAGTPELPLQPIEAVAKGSAKLPVIIGGAKHEMALMLAGAGMDPRKVTEEQYEQRMKATFGDKAAALIAGYKANHPDYSPGDLLVRALTDTWRQAELQLADAHVRSGGPTWMYLFEWESPVLPWLHAAHGIDGSFYFDNTEALPITQGNPQARALAAKASTAWANFARNGTPTAPGLDWPRYTAEKRETLIWAVPTRVEDNPLASDVALRDRVTPLT